MKKCLYTLVLAVLLLSSQQAFSGIYAGGTGTSDDPFQIATADHIEEMRAYPNDWDKHFMMTANIDLAGRAYSTSVIAPDTEVANPAYVGICFSGVFDGNGHVINNLAINTVPIGTDYIGLFGKICGSSAEVKNLGMENVNVNARNGSYNTGGLAGRNFGTISNCYVTGTVSGNEYTGGLVGTNDGYLISCYASGDVSGSRHVGGLAGGNNNNGIVSNCYATVNVTDSNVNSIVQNSHFGGLLGVCTGDVTNCYATGNIKDAVLYTGGLVGAASNANMTNNYATGRVKGVDCVGGLVGGMSGSYTANNYATGHVSGSDRIGGLVGKLWNGNMTNNRATGDVSGDDFVGGLIGEMLDGNITSNYTTCDVSGSDSVGGFVGSMLDGQTVNNYSICNVSGETNIGGFIGSNTGGSISKCYAACNIEGINYVGGFSGHSGNGSFEGCFWDIEINPILPDAGDLNDHSGIMGRTTLEMYIQNTFAGYGWDFVGEGQNGTEDMWYLSSCGGHYPTLSMQPVGTVPEVTGLSKDEALMLIESAGINVTVKTIHSAIIPERHVISQDPPAECEAAVITLVISDGIAGSGSESDPYLIWSGWQMNTIASFPEDFGKHFVLMADIDISAYTDDSFNIIGDLENNFTGVFDGKGHTIKGLTYTSSEKDHIGLFGYLGQDAHIKNLGLIDVCIDAGIGNGIGSIAGRNKNGTISNCYAIGSVKSKWSVGGLVGINYGSILNCYTLGTIIGDQNTGGLVGVNVGSVINCYSAAFVSGRHRQGALIGYDKNGNYNASFWNSDINPNLPGVGPFANLTEVIGRTTFEMMTQNTFTDYGWEFVGEQTNGTEEIWWIEEGAGYPRLWWEYVKPLEPKELLEQLLQDVVAMELKQGIEKSLLVKLAAVLRKLGDDNKENDVAAINSLRAFTNEVKAQSGKSILPAKADALIDTVEQIIELLQSLSNPVEEEASTRQSKIVTYKKISKAKQNIDTKPKKQQLRKTKYQVPKKQKVLPLQKTYYKKYPQNHPTKTTKNSPTKVRKRERLTLPPTKI